MMTRLMMGATHRPPTAMHRLACHPPTRLPEFQAPGFGLFEDKRKRRLLLIHLEPRTSKPGTRSVLPGFSLLGPVQLI